MRPSVPGLFCATIVIASAWTLMSLSSGALAQVESTGFEAEDGWVAGYSICGPEFADTCSYPVTDVCIPDDHAANQNCCSLDPNPATGWYMADDSRHCNEPHVEATNPYSGTQHLRIASDAEAASQAVAFTPRLPLQVKARTVISFQLSGTGESLLEFAALAEDDPAGEIAARLRFDPAGYLLEYRPSVIGDFFYIGVWDVGQGYRRLSVDLDPSRNTIRYCYDDELFEARTLDPNQGRSVQQAVITTDVGGGWDIDEFSIVRGSSGAVCRAPAVECNVSPCATLLVKAINGIVTAPTSEAYVRPGDLVEAELYLSGWGEGLRALYAYDVRLQLRRAAAMGISGTVLPFGWDAPLDRITCGTNADCPKQFPVCSTSLCIGQDHHPNLGAYIDTGRPDFILYGLDPVQVCAYNLPGFVYAAAAYNRESGAVDPGVPRYMGTLIVVASDDAAGSFAVDVNDGQTEYSEPFPNASSTRGSHRTLVLHVCEDDGLFCNGLESSQTGKCVVTGVPDCDDGNDCTDDFCDEDTDSCAHVATCGACCDSWLGECEEAAAQADCDCANCIWSGGEACADVACEAEFIPIPTVSQWGLAILGLLLLIAAKVGFGESRASAGGNLATDKPSLSVPPSSTDPRKRGSQSRGTLQFRFRP